MMSTMSLADVSPLLGALGNNWLSVLVAVILAVGSSGAITAYMRNRKDSPEGSKMVIDAAQGAVIVQTGVITSLREELETQRVSFTAEIDRQNSEIAELRTHLAELNSLRTRVRDLEQHNEILAAENTMLKSQVKALSKMVHDQEKKNGT